MSKAGKLPQWGPYSKKYMGISHVIEGLKNEGGRFDFIVHPTLWNSSIPVPNVTFPSNYHLMECANDFSFYSYRYELKGKESVYADISFTKLKENAFLARCEFVNNSAKSEECLLNTFASLELPTFVKTEAVLPNGSVFYKANDYVSYDYAIPRPWDTENPDGMCKGMFKDCEFTLGFGLGDRVGNNHVKYMGLRPFGCEKGDRVLWNPEKGNHTDPVIALRYRTVTKGDGLFSFNGKEIILPASENLTIIKLPYAENIELVSLGGAGVEFDFLAVISKDESVFIKRVTLPYEPKVDLRKSENGAVIRLDYAINPDCKYTITTHNKNTRLRHIYSGCLEDALPNRLSNGDPTFDRLQQTFSNSFSPKASDEGHFVNPLVRSIWVEPGTSHTEYIVISKGDFEPKSFEEYESAYLKAKEQAKAPLFNSDGETYSFSVNMLRTTLLTNVVYPVFKKDGNVIHYTPGKRWDSFYTWDSGFTGLGLLEADPELCRYMLETYLCEEDNKDYTFLAHGSLVPTQFPEYLELLKRTKDKNELNDIYEKLKRYYEFLRGRRGSSTFGKFGNGLLTAYDYWYSCSGMDDYPAQVKMIADKAEAYSCPCITTAQVILAGKILRMAASFLGKEQDMAQYEKDISESTDSLNKYAWDEESGYYGYTLYDKDASKPYIMKTEKGENCNKGMDGIYPLIAGAADGERKQKLIAHLKNPKEMWSSAGISAVDKSAEYYMEDGYWNGNVWMPHQWFVWKAMLDNGEADFAYEIAKRALDIWKEETDDSWNTYECFNIRTHRGGWFHQFGGLSSPVLIWADAYFKPGTITTGFDVLICNQYSGDKEIRTDFKYFGKSENYTMLFTAKEGSVAEVTLNGVPVDIKQRTLGTVELTLPGTVREGSVRISLNKA